MPRKFLEIGLFMPTSVGFYADVLAGVRGYARAGQWTFNMWPDVPSAMEQVQRLRPDGIISSLYQPKWVDLLKRLGIPTVAVLELPGAELPRVGLDDEAIGRLGARHFLDRGFKHLGFCGYPTVRFSLRREAGFRDEGERAGREVMTYTAPAAYASGQDVGEALAAWLTALPKPVGVMACHDWFGVVVAQAARFAGLAIPEQVALLGVDDNASECDFTHPPLSSIAVGAGRVGHSAAEMLDSLMSGGAATRPVRTIEYPPVEVVTRQSTDVLAIDDPDVAAAVRFIRDHAADPIDVTDVMREVPVSRRMLERKFQKVLGRGPRQEIRRVHVERAKELLARTDLPTPDVAERSGFPHAPKLSNVFRQMTGMTPTDYRRQFRTRPRGW